MAAPARGAGGRRTFERSASDARRARCPGHDGPQLLEHASAQYAGLRGQANPLIVGESEPPRSQLLAEHAILLLQIGDDVALLLVDPAGQRDQKEP